MGITYGLLCQCKGQCHLTFHNSCQQLTPVDHVVGQETGQRWVALIPTKDVVHKVKVLRACELIKQTTPFNGMKPVTKIMIYPVDLPENFVNLVMLSGRKYLV